MALEKKPSELLAIGKLDRETEFSHVVSTQLSLLSLGNDFGKRSASKMSSLVKRTTRVRSWGCYGNCELWFCHFNICRVRYHQSGGRCHTRWGKRAFEAPTSTDLTPGATGNRKLIVTGGGSPVTISVVTSVVGVSIKEGKLPSNNFGSPRNRPNYESLGKFWK